MGKAHPLYDVVMLCRMDRPDNRPTSNCKELNGIITALFTQYKNSSIKSIIIFNASLLRFVTSPKAMGK